MPSLWHQSVFGKLVDPATDCIVPGVEYARTGVGRAFPQGAQGACSPRAIGVSDHIDWTNYPWKRQQAQFTLRPVLGTDGVWYLQAARLLVRREQRDTGGRYFHHTSYAVTPLDALADDLDLFALPGLLVAAPLPARTDLDPLYVSGPDLPLPPGWFDEDVRTMLAAVFAGVGAAYQARDASADEFLALALRCAACLPRAVRWRLTLGAAFPETPEGFALAHGVTANGKVRRSGGVWRGADAPQLGAVDELVRRVERAVALACSASELLRLADECWGPDLRDRCPPGLSAELGWAEAVGALRERDNRTALRAYLTGHTSARPNLNEFRHDRAGALAEVVTAVVAGGAADLLDPCWAPDWAPAWESVARGHPSASPKAAARTVVALRGSAPFDPTGFDAAGAALLPYAETVEAAERIARAYTQTAPADRPVWGPLIAAAGREPTPPVLRAWVAARPNEVLWAGIDLETRAEPVWCVSGWSNPGSVLRAYLALLSGRLPDVADFTALYQDVPQTFAETASRLAARTGVMGLVAEAALLSAAPRDRDALAPAERASVADKLAAGVLRYGPVPALVRAIIDLWDELKPDREEALASVLGPLVPAQFHRALFDNRTVPPNTTGRRFEAAPFEAAVARFTARSEEHRRRTRPAPAGHLADPVPVAALVFDPADEAVAERFLRDLDESRCLRLPDLTAAQARAAARRFDNLPKGKSLPAPPPEISSPGQARAAAAVAHQVFKNDWENARADQFVPTLLAEPDPDFWQRAAVAARMTTVPVFRLLTAGKLDQPRGAEEELLLKLPDRSFAPVVSRFPQLTAPLLGRVLALLGSGFAFEPTFLRAFAKSGGSKDVRELITDAVFRNLIGRLSPRERAEVLDAPRGAQGTGSGNVQFVLDILHNRVGWTWGAAEWTKWLKASSDEPCPPGILFELSDLSE